MALTNWLSFDIYISKTRVTTRSIQIFFSYHYFCMKFLEIFGNPDIPLNVYFFKLRSLQLFEINHNRETKLSTQCFIFNLKRTISRLLYVFVPRFQKYELFPSINIILFRVLWVLPTNNRDCLLYSFCRYSAIAYLTSLKGKIKQSRNNLDNW